MKCYNDLPYNKCRLGKSYKLDAILDKNKSHFVALYTFNTLECKAKFRLIHLYDRTQIITYNGDLSQFNLFIRIELDVVHQALKSFTVCLFVTLNRTYLMNYSLNRLETLRL